MQNLSGPFVLAYHGCDKETAEALIAGQPFVPSENGHDWLGHGIYFWEADPIRGLSWARLQQERGNVGEPAVVGVAISLGLCLDLTQQKSLDVIRTAYDDLAAVVSEDEIELPRNSDEFRRERDCLVLNYLYETMPEPRFQTARCPFMEGKPLFDGSHIPSLTHIQIVVRDVSCIKGVFRVPADQLT